MKCALFMLLSLLLSLPTLTIAQTDDNTDWPVTERCVGEPTAPPKDWTFEGTIFTQDNPLTYADDTGGIHAIRTDMPTP